MFLDPMSYPEPKGIREQQHDSKSVVVSRRMERCTEPGSTERRSVIVFT